MNDYDYRKITLLLTLILVVGLCLYQYRNLWLFRTDGPKPAIIVVEDKTASLSLDELLESCAESIPKVAKKTTKGAIIE